MRPAASPSGLAGSRARVSVTSRCYGLRKAASPSTNRARQGISPVAADHPRTTRGSVAPSRPGSRTRRGRASGGGHGFLPRRQWLVVPRCDSRSFGIHRSASTPVTKEKTALCQTSTICSFDRPGVGRRPAPLTFSTVWSKLQAHDRVREVGPRTAQTDHRPDATERTQRGPGGPVEELVGHERLGLVWGMAADQGEQRSSGHIGVRTSGERLLDLLPHRHRRHAQTPATAPRRAPRTRKGPRRLNSLIRSPLLRSFRRRLDPPATPRAASQPSRGTSGLASVASSVPVRPAGCGGSRGGSATGAR